MKKINGFFNFVKSFANYFVKSPAKNIKTNLDKTHYFTSLEKTANFHHYIDGRTERYWSIKQNTKIWLDQEGNRTGNIVFEDRKNGTRLYLTSFRHPLFDETLFSVKHNMINPDVKYFRMEDGKSLKEITQNEYQQTCDSAISVSAINNLRIKSPYIDSFAKAAKRNKL